MKEDGFEFRRHFQEQNFDKILFVIKFTTGKFLAEV